MWKQAKRQHSKFSQALSKIYEPLQGTPMDRGVAAEGGKGTAGQAQGAA